MKYHLKVLIAVSVATLLSACASGPAFVKLENPDQGQAKVYVYRTFNLMQSGIFPDVYVDSNLVGKMKNGGFFAFSAKPGTHTVTLSGNYLQWHYNDHSVPLAVAANETYFYRLKTISNTGYAFKEVDKEEALKELKELKAVE